MNPEEIRRVFNSEVFGSVFETQEGFQLMTAETNNGFMILNEIGIFAVEAIFFPAERSIPFVEVKRENGTDLGLLVLTKGRILNSFEALAASEFLAYLAEVQESEFGKAGYTFQKDYFISSDGEALEYKENFFESAPIWGQFTHIEPPKQSAKTFSDIVALEGIILPSSHHREAFSRYVHAKNASERFLRLYHCIELLFDAVIVLKIKKLRNDIKEFATIMSEHGKSELDRLNAIASNHLTDAESMAKCFVEISSHLDISTKVFQDFGKETNPLSTKRNGERWNSLVSALQKNQYSATEFTAAKVIEKNGDYPEFVAKISSYWIYRIRCCIAHSRIGEYVLEDSDHEFIARFAEPLLLEFVKQVFRSQALRDLT